MINLTDPVTFDAWDRYLVANGRARCAYRYDLLTERDVERYFRRDEKRVAA